MRSTLLAIIFLSFTFAGCQTVNNTIMEKVFGYEKRQLLKTAVESLSKDQKKAQTEFKDAMTQLKELYGFKGGSLETTYNKIKGAYEDSKAQADVVRKRIANMESISASMFSEWNKEISQYSNPTFAKNSRQQLADTKAKYGQLISAVRNSESSMDPILTQLNDHVLYLKHNLNAAAIGSLKSEGADIQAQIEGLIKKMNASISEADVFIATLLKS